MNFRDIFRMVRRGFRMLATFSGRDTPAQFWPYAIFLYLALSASGGILVLVQLNCLLFGSAEAAFCHNAAPSTSISPTIDLANVRTVIWLTGGTSAIATALLASAVTRRLHDRDQPGSWGLMPLPFVGFGLYSMTRFFETGNSDHVFEGFLSNILFMAAVAFLIVHLAGRGTRGPNRYGEDPAAPLD
jgi:uncharacterized membrane protein YhaH (DUF805 family)